MYCYFHAEILIVVASCYHCLSVLGALPSVSCLCFHLQKKLDFTLKVVGGDLSSIPGVSDALEV